MIRIGHLFDDAAGWEQRLALDQLLNGLPPASFASFLATLDPAGATPLRLLKQPVDRLVILGGWTALSGPTVARFVRRRRLDLVHAWGIRAAMAARTLTDIPLVLHLFDPRLAVGHVKRLRAMAQQREFAIVCSCEIVRRRLIEGGLSPQQTVVIRPAVDFHLINETRRGPLRKRIGVAQGRPLYLVPEPVTRADGQFEAFWAVAMLNSITGDRRIILPGESRELNRIRRVAATVPGSNAMIATGNSQPFEKLVAVADALLVTPYHDTSTTSIAWAMAAGVPVIASAVYAVTELIAHQVNGLLFKNKPRRGMAVRILNLLRDHASQDKARETARAQAYDVFSLRRYIDQYKLLYGNVLSGLPPGRGITDSAAIRS